MPTILAAGKAAALSFSPALTRPMRVRYPPIDARPWLSCRRTTSAPAGDVTEARSQWEWLDADGGGRWAQRSAALRASSRSTSSAGLSVKARLAIIAKALGDVVGVALRTAGGAQRESHDDAAQQLLWGRAPELPEVCTICWTGAWRIHQRIDDTQVKIDDAVGGGDHHQGVTLLRPAVRAGALRPHGAPQGLGRAHRPAEPMLMACVALDGPRGPAAGPGGEGIEGMWPPGWRCKSP
ncbi:MAG: hypothetical protein M5U16_00015 [Hyphomicrobium sp.]|nr:hypothetical protein [Hyphomicrobium sp.]